MKMSLREMTCRQLRLAFGHCYQRHVCATFSCRRCLSSLSSRYVRLARTGVLKGFMIFLTATFWLVSWSLAELKHTVSKVICCCCVGCSTAVVTSWGGCYIPYEAKGPHANRLEVGVPINQILEYEARMLLKCVDLGEGEEGQ